MQIAIDIIDFINDFNEPIEVFEWLNIGTSISSQRQNGFIGALAFIEKSLQMNKEFILHSDVEVFSIPDGEKILLKKGIPGIITQSLGNNFTIVVEGNMYQVKGSDAEAIGEEKKSIVSNNFANKEEVWNILQTCYDPEIPVNIVDLGLVYDCTISEEKDGVSVSIQMTLTAPGCGMGPIIADEVKEKILSLHGTKSVEVELVWEPQWNQDMMSDAAKLQLGLY